jgi:tetratricopeptide (TPR) repeat protein
MIASTVTGGAESSPYVGDRPFGAQDAEAFFGRTVEIAGVASLWRRHRLTVLFGPSGSGLTSLLRAGVLPQLAGLSIEVLPVGRVSQRSTFPVAALSEHNPYTLSLLSAWSPAESQTRLARLTLVDFLGKRWRYIRHRDAYGDTSPVLSAIDQAEELLTGQVDSNRSSEAFIGQLAAALREISELHVVICVRSDYKGELVARLTDGGCVVDAEYELHPLSPKAALDAVRLPLQQAGRSFASGAAEDIVADLSGGGDRDAAEIAPAMLQAVCARLWRTVPAHVREVTDLELTRRGGVRQWLADYCDMAVLTVSRDYGLPAEELSTWLREWFITGLGKRAFVDEGLTHTKGMPNAIVLALRDLHVITAELRAGSRWFTLQHDCLVAPVREARDRFRDLAAVLSERQTPAEYLTAAQSAMAAGDLTLAQRHAGQALRQSSGQDLRLSASAESLLGNVAYGRGNMAEAETHYRAAAALSETLQDTPLVAYLLAAIGRTQLIRRHYREAVECLYGAVARVPSDPTVQTELVHALELSELAG